MFWSYRQIKKIGEKSLSLQANLDFVIFKTTKQLKEKDKQKQQEKTLLFYHFGIAVYILTRNKLRTMNDNCKSRKLNWNTIYYIIFLLNFIWRNMDVYS